MEPSISGRSTMYAGNLAMKDNNIYWDVINQRKPIVSAQFQHYNYTGISVKIVVPSMEAD